jgi:hypothetical protein
MDSCKFREVVVHCAMPFDKELAKTVAKALIKNADEAGLDDSFAHVAEFLYLHPEKFSIKKNPPSLETEEGLTKLAKRYYKAYRKSDLPTAPQTVPDEMVSLVLEKAYGYTPEQTQIIKLDHQRAMCAEGAVGKMLERYLDSKLRKGGWHWCCGSFVKAIDFVRLGDDGEWDALQIKNRDNSENSSSSAIRAGTTIEIWFRTFSKTGESNWDDLPPLMNGYGLSDEDFAEYVESYITQEMAALKVASEQLALFDGRPSRGA